MSSRAERVPSVVTLVPEDDDIDEDLEVSQPLADAHLVDLDKIEGYEQIGLPGDMTVLSVPASDSHKFDPDAGIKTFKQIPKITERIARDVLMNGASDQCCSSKAFIEDMPITKIETTLAWHYSVESFVESRSTCWSFEPYVKNMPIDGPQKGQAPGPWDVKLKPKKTFVEEESVCTVPHSDQVKPCHHCFKQGLIQCFQCRGKKLLKCAHCGGQGKKNYMQGGINQRMKCSSCDGKGKKKCKVCSGNGDVTCPTCKGKQDLIFSIKLKCEWKNKETDFIEEKTDLPDELVRDVTGKTIFVEEDTVISPIQNFPLKTVNSASKKLVLEHDQDLKNCRKVRQRHHLRAVPVTEIHYEHDSKRGIYFIYGFENKLWIEKFPTASACTIL